jgi:HAMP domain-containing protein
VKNKTSTASTAELKNAAVALAIVKARCCGWAATNRRSSPISVRSRTRSAGDGAGSGVRMGEIIAAELR